MKKIPVLLIWSRLATAVLILLATRLNSSLFTALFIPLFSYGLLSDVFDGIIARRMGVSTVNMRRLDSVVDQVFWIAIAAAAFLRCPEFFTGHWKKITILLVLELATYGVSFGRFRKEVALHSLGAKFWVLTLFATLMEIVVSCKSGLLFEICFYAGVVTRLEVIAILSVLRAWTNDVPSLYHAIRLRRGKPVKRHKLFNG